MWRQIGNFFYHLDQETFRSLSILPLPPYIWPQMKTVQSLKSIGEQLNLLLRCCCKSQQNPKYFCKSQRWRVGIVGGFSAHVWSFNLLTSLGQTPNGYLSDVVVGGVNVNPTLEWGGLMNKTADSSVRRHLSSQLLMEFLLLLGGEQMVTEGWRTQHVYHVPPRVQLLVSTWEDTTSQTYTV